MASSNAADALFSPITIGGLELANRIVMAPMTRCFSPDGVPGDDVVAYYRRRAEHGVGLIITEGVGIDHASALGAAGLNETAIPHIHGDAALAGWRRVVEAVHAAGSRIAPQLWHQGVMREKGSGPDPDAEPMRPSGLWGPRTDRNTLNPAYLEQTFEPTRPMTADEIEAVIDAYVRGAVAAMEVGFDAVALHGAHGYMIDNFLWKETNRREDEWGGDIARRGRFAVEIVRRIRAAIGPDAPIIFRFSQWKQHDYGARLAETPEELAEVLLPLAAAGVDVFDASTRAFDRPAFDGDPRSLAAWTRAITGKTTMAVGQIGLNKGLFDDRAGNLSDVVDNIPQVAAGLRRGDFDLVGVGRALLNDPEWPRRVRHGIPQKAYDMASYKVLT